MENIQIHRVYAKNFRFEFNDTVVEKTALSLVNYDAWQPQISLQVNPRFKALKGGRYELVLATQIMLHDPNQTEPLVSVYVEQAGLFTLPKVSKKEYEKLLYGVCANFLFPYMGATINALLAQAALAPIYLAPVDFVVLYERYAAEQAQNKIAKNFFVSSSYNEKTIH
jgi:protein-export chaperone SecB